MQAVARVVQLLQRLFGSAVLVSRRHLRRYGVQGVQRVQVMPRADRHAQTLGLGAQLFGFGVGNGLQTRHFIACAPHLGGVGVQSLNGAAVRQ